MRGVLLSLALAFSSSDAFLSSGRWALPGRASTGVAAWRPMRAAPVLRSSVQEQTADAAAPAPEGVAAEVVWPAGPQLAQGTCLVSGFFDDPSRVDQTVFDYLHKQDTFAKIVAYTSDVSFAQKRLVSRSARYTGLLDVLDFKEGGASELPDALKDADCWLAFNVPMGDVTAQAEMAKAAGVKKLVVVAVTSSSEPDFSDAVKVLADSSVSYTLLAVHSFDDAIREGGGVVVVKTPQTANDTAAAAAVVAAADGVPEATAAAVAAFPSTASTAFSRDEAIRYAAESVLLPPAHNAAYLLSLGDDYALNYTKGLRAKGYTRAEEVGFLMTGGYQAHLLNVTTANAEKARKEAEALARKNAPVDPEKVRAEREASDREFWARQEMQREEKIVKKTQLLTDNAFLTQRYMKAPVEGLLSETYGMRNQEVYNESVYPLYYKYVSEEATFDERGNIVLMDDEDKARQADIERIEEAMEERRIREEEREMEEMKVTIDGVTYLGYEVGGVLFMLDENGEDILGKWNFEEDKMDPYEPGDEVKAYEEEERMEREGYYYDFSEFSRKKDEKEAKETADAEGASASEGEDSKAAASEESDGSADVAEKDE